jgi:hypothetical protein
MTHQHVYLKTLFAKVIEPTNKGVKVLTMDKNGFTKTEKTGKIQFFSNNEWNTLFKPI